MSTHPIYPANSHSPPSQAPPSAALDPLSGLAHLGDAGRANALDPKANPIEKKKNAKSGAVMWEEGERWGGGR